MPDRRRGRPGTARLRHRRVRARHQRQHRPDVLRPTDGRVRRRQQRRRRGSVVPGRRPGRGRHLRVGRFLSGIGYLNEQHAHTWDFVDAPLAYQAFFGGPIKTDGLQLRWVAPTDRFLELGAEIGSGTSLPGQRQRPQRRRLDDACSRTSATTSARARAGASASRCSRNRADDRAYDDVDGAGIAGHQQLQRPDARTGASTASTSGRPTATRRGATSSCRASTSSAASAAR